jgi:2-C-methyl-D-erythritol 4-phosphate cytidylyltransferase
VGRIVIVLDQAYREEYSFLARADPRIVFADPGKERQDSVFNGFSQTLPDASVVCIHDSARPLASQHSVLEVRCWSNAADGLMLPTEAVHL